MRIESHQKLNVDGPDVSLSSDETQFVELLKKDFPQVLAQSFYVKVGKC